MTFISENKLQKEHFLGSYDCFFGDLFIHFEPLLGWKRSYLCRKELTVKSKIKKQGIGIQVTSSQKISIKKNVPLSKCDHFFQKLCVHFEPLLGWESAFICHDLRTEKEGIYVKRQENKRNN